MTTEKINYIELPARDIEGSKRFCSDPSGNEYAVWSES